MKLCKLKLKNLNSFRKEVEIDFEKSPLDDASLVAITGPTGAGKTTLLDAICVALYGKTPRLSGNQNQHPRHLISHGKMEGFAEVHFEANGARYQATWSIKRNGSPKSQLFDDSGELITTKVAQEVGFILGFDFDTFKRSIMLAQGEFAAFLKADLKDRREILEKTAGIGIYNKLNDKLNEKENEVRKVYEHLSLELDVMPVASRDGIVLLEKELDELKDRDKELDERSRKIQKEIESEKKRKEDYEKLQSSEKRQGELSSQQPEIDARQVELENAKRAAHLRTEKQEFGNAKSELEKSMEAFRVATTEQIKVAKQVKADQTDFDEKEKVYQTASTEHKQKVDVYKNAKLDVGRAADQCAEADKQTVKLGDLDDEIGTLSELLTNSETEQTQLQQQIKEVRVFLEKNPLPADRQHRLNRANVLSTQLDSQQEQLETALTSEATHSESVSVLKKKINELSETREERLSEKTHAKTALNAAATELNKLLASGTHEEWTARKQQASKAQPIAQKYEATQDDLADAENQLSALNDTTAAQEVELEQIEIDLARQNRVCQRATAAVQSCEESLKLALLADSANQLRQHLHEGEPCPVCGATEHPGHGVVMESEGEERLQNAESALEHAKTEAQDAEAHRQTLKTRQAQTERDKRNIISQIDDLTDEVETLRDKASRLLAEWQVIYPDAGVSSGWVSEQFGIADTTIADITEAEQTHVKASNALQIVSQQLETSENDIKRETNGLSDIETQLEDLSNTVAGLQTDVTATETRFWESMPDIFHDIAPAAAVKQFDDKIQEVEKREGERDSAKTQLQVLNVNIEADRDRLQDLKNSREGLKTEIDEYRSDGETYLNAVRDKTDGLETETEIDVAIDKLEAELQEKVKARDDAEQQLQNSQKLLTQKQTTHGHCEEQYEKSSEKLETARHGYFDKLGEAGFDSSEAHDNAFRDETQMQKLIDQINAHENQKQQLEVEIAKLKTRFEETPFDLEVLERIEIETEEIESHSQDLQHQIWSKQEEKRRLTDVLSDREALESEVQCAAKELERWGSLKDMIGGNKLFNFASTIILEQVNRFANEQLESLSSGRYQLKAEEVDDKLKLTIVDRWNANEERPVETLSGGESFLTSLALALALSDLSRGRAQLNSLFLDEGFGTLDVKTLDVAIAALEDLYVHGRSIFLISHVQELTRRLPVKINVKKHGDNSLDSLDSSYSSSIDIRG